MAKDKVGVASLRNFFLVVARGGSLFQGLFGRGLGWVPF